MPKMLHYTTISMHDIVAINIFMLIGVILTLILLATCAKPNKKSSSYHTLIVSLQTLFTINVLSIIFIFLVIPFFKISLAIFNIVFIVILAISVISTVFSLFSYAKE